MKTITKLALSSIVVVAVLCVAVLVWHSSRTIVVADGNSLTAGYGLDRRDRYPSQLKRALWMRCRVFNVGVSGATTSQLAARARDIDPLFKPGGVVVFGEGSNELFFGTNITDALSSMRDYVSARTAVGWKVIVMTVPPRAQAGFEEKRQAFNREVRALGLEIADIAADPNIGCAGCETNRAFFFDGTHYTAAGAKIASEIVARKFR